MAREVVIGDRKFYIVSEPNEIRGWKAQVLEVLDTGADSKGADSKTMGTGIETTGATRSEADERALGVLQHKLRDEPLPT
jgi:hypothetical protein